MSEKRLRVVLHVEGVLSELWGPEAYYTADGMTAKEVAAELLQEDWSSLLEELVGQTQDGLMDLGRLIQSAEWVEVTGPESEEVEG